MKKSSLKLLPFILVFTIIINTFFVYGNSANIYPVNDEFRSVINVLKSTYPVQTDTLRIMSYNLLADTPGYRGSPAYSRSSEVAYLLNTLNPDVTGLQEVSRNWFYALSQEKNFGFISPVKTTIFGNMTAIIYNKKTLILSNWGEYVFEKTFDATLRRAVWGVFRQKSTDKAFLVINTHLSLSKEETDTPIKQTMEALDLVKRLKEQYKCPVFFTGDFNSYKRISEESSSSDVYEALCTSLTDTIKQATEKSSGENLNLKSRAVDHIFLNGEAQVNRYVILSQSVFSPLSDHYPIFIDVML